MSSLSTFQLLGFEAPLGWEQRGEVGAVREVVGGVIVMGSMLLRWVEDEGAEDTPA